MARSQLDVQYGTKREPIQYALHPGWVGPHYISYGMLIKLYNLPQQRCIDMSITSFMWRGFSKEELDALIHLHPRDDGDYKEHLATMKGEVSEGAE